MKQSRRQQLEPLYSSIQAFARVYTFRDPSNACLFDLRVNECYVLDILVEEGELSTSALADRLGIHKSNASRIAVALQDQGLVDSRQDGQDRRVVNIAPTEKGRLARAGVKNHLIDKLKGVLADFNAEELRTGQEIINRLAMDAERRIVQSDTAVQTSSRCTTRAKHQQKTGAS